LAGYPNLPKNGTGFIQEKKELVFCFACFLPRHASQSGAMTARSSSLSLWMASKENRLTKRGKGSGKREFSRGGSIETAGFQGAKRLHSWAKR